MSDLIERQTAIDVARKCSVKEVTPAYMLIDKAEVMTELMMLPSAQPEIIFCKDCKYQDEGYRRIAVKWLPCMDVRVPSMWYCGSTERREE